MGIDRVGWGTAIKLLSTVILATGVAFVLSMDKPSDLDARFGMGVGALLAVAASAFVGTGLQDRPLVLDSPVAVFYGWVVWAIVKAVR